MLVLLDANAVVSDPLFRHTVWKSVAANIAAGAMRVVLPLLAFDEAVSSYTALRRKTASDIRAASKHSVSAAKVHIEKAAAITDDEADSYSDRLTARLAELGVELLATTEEWTHHELALRAISRTPPFDERGSGYRDTLHWLLLISLVREDPDDEYILVSRDSAFVAPDKESMHPVLALEAEKELDVGTIGLRRDIKDIPTPGKYMGDAQETKEYDEEVADLVQEAVANGLWREGLDPDDFDLQSADSVSLVSIADAAAVVVEARRLSQSRELELRFVVDAIGTFSTSSLLEDTGQPPQLVTENLEKKIRIRGVANVDSIDDLRNAESLEVELSPHEYTRSLAQSIAILQQITSQAKEQVSAAFSTSAIQAFARALQSKPQGRSR